MVIKKSIVNPNQALADVRSQIDQIDNVIHDLLIKRADVVHQVKQIKGKQKLFIRPGREATMLRALTDHPQGNIPPGLVVRIWREMISLFTVMESGGFKVGVYSPKKGPNLWDMTRDHYGPFTDLVEFTTAKAAIKALQANEIAMAVVPMPEQDDKDCWWKDAAKGKKSAYTVFQSMPFETPKGLTWNGRNSLEMGLMIGPLYPELTGDDRSLLAFDCVHVPEAEMKRLLGKAGYKVRRFIEKSSGRSSSVSYFAEVDGFVSRTDTRLGRIKAMLGSRLKLLTPLGGYPLPLKIGRRS